MPKKDHTASGSAIAGAGAITAGTGFVAGGVPGVKPDGNTVFNTKPPQGTGLKRQVSRVTGKMPARKATPGGILGFRTDIHEGGTRHFQAQAARYASRKVQPGKEASHAYSHNYTEGKIAPERQVIRHMKGGRKVANLALVGGTAATAYGIRRARQKVEKAQRQSDKLHGAELGAGGAAAGAAFGGHKLLRHQEKTWANRARSGVTEAQKLVPGLGGLKSNQNMRQYQRHLARGGTPENFPKTTTPERDTADILRDKKVFHGVHPKTAAKAGQLRGAAAQAEHFSHVYGNTAKVVGRLRAPASIVAGAGAAGLATSRMKSKKVQKNSRMSAFGVEH